jgi:hypothetical protein
MNHRVFLAGVALCAAACAGKRTEPTDAGTTGAIIIRRAEMRTGTLLEGIKPRLPMMNVSQQAGQCPLVTFRGVRTFGAAADPPSVYLDGTLLTNTCPLNELSTNQVDVVEVYTSGSSGRPGVQRNPSGVILIFSRK